MRFFLLFFLIFKFAFSYPSDEKLHFSPNLDGIKDTVSIEIRIKEDNLKTWKVLIYEKTGSSYRLIREYRSVDSKEIQKMTWKKFFNRVFSIKRPVDVPQKVEWDGYRKIPQSADKYKMDKMKDGVYFYRVLASDEAGNRATSALIPIRLDTLTPDITADFEHDTFSPNGDGHKETLSFLLKINQLDPRDKISIEFKDEAGEIAKSSLISGSEIQGKRVKLKWDGLKDNSKKAKQGIYTLEIEAFDPAGNRRKLPSQKIELVRTMEVLTLTANADAFSPDDNGYSDILTFTLDASSQEGLESWKIVAVDEAGKVQDVFSGKESLPKYLSFDGMHQGNELFHDGLYRAILHAKYRSGNQPQSDAVSFTIDTSAPDLDVEIINKDDVFIPKATQNNKLRVRQSVKGLRKDETFYGRIADEEGTHVYQRDFGPNLPAVFEWDGTQDNGTVQPGKYVYTLSGKDPLGNSAEVSTAMFELVDELAAFFVKADKAAFSPNGDGHKDDVVFLLRAKPKSQARLRHLSIDIMDKDKIIRSLSSKSFEKAFSWDGKKINGELAADKLYRYVLTAELTGDETFKTEPKPIILDTVPVKIELKAKKKVFSPNGDGNQDKLVITQKKIPSSLAGKQDKIRLEIRDMKGKIQRQVDWKGTIPTLVRWSGKNQIKQDVPQGSYEYRLNTEDLAGNKSSFKIAPLELVRDMEKVDFSLTQRYYSPSNNVIPNPRLLPKLENAKALQSYRYLAENKKGDLFVLYRHEGREGWENPFVFAGKDIEGKPLATGLYEVKLQAHYHSGNQPVSVSKKLIVDPKGPSITIRSRPSYFSPDGDGADETLNIRIQLRDPSGIKKAQLLVFRRREFDTKGEPFQQTLDHYLKKKEAFRSWPLQGGINTIDWDGKNTEGNLKVESANDYVLFARATDNAGNPSIEKSITTVDILVEKLADGRYRIIINSIHFKYNSDRMLGNYKKTLDRLSVILHKFSNYQIEIAGHTDSRGGDAYNQELSLQRAKSVYDYLQRKDIAKDRMTISGKGEKELIIKDEKTEDDYRQNRRVEFYLLKHQ